MPENGINDSHLRMHIADPCHPVPLDAVPELLLHVQIKGVGTYFPDLIQASVIACEAALVFQIVIEEDGPNMLDVYSRTFIHHIDPDKTKARISDLSDSRKGTGTIES